METSTKQSVAPVATNRSNDVRGYWLDVAIQMGFVWFLAASTWYVLGPDAQSISEHRQRLILVGLGYAMAVGLWIMGSRQSPITKMVWLSILFSIALLAGLNFAWEFEISARIMEPAQVKQGRVVHEGIGLSYAMLPDSRGDLLPVITRSYSPDTDKSKLPTRLQEGEMAILSQIMLTPKSPQPGRMPSSITVKAQHYWARNLNAFIRDIRQHEAKKLTIPNSRIIQQTHHSNIAGIDLVEFEYEIVPQHFFSRQVYLRAGPFMLNFMLDTVNEADRRLFDEFLKSIRLDPIPSYLSWPTNPAPAK